MNPEQGKPSTLAGEGAQLGKRFREVREYLGFSQQMVSDRTGIARSAISDIERGTRKVDSLELKKLARLYRPLRGISSTSVPMRRQVIMQSQDWPRPRPTHRG